MKSSIPDNLFNAEARSENMFLTRGAELLTAHGLHKYYMSNFIPPSDRDQDLERQHHPENFAPEPLDTCPDCGEATDNGLDNSIICNQSAKD